MTTPCATSSCKTRPKTSCAPGTMPAACRSSVFFITSGQQYRALELKDRLPQMSMDEQYALLATDGMLVKRPMLIGDDFVLVGFKEPDWSERLL